MSKDLNKHELLRRLFDYWDVKYSELEQEKNEAEHINTKIALSYELSGFNNAFCDIVGIINDYHKELINENREE